MKLINNYWIVTDRGKLSICLTDAASKNMAKPKQPKSQSTSKAQPEMDFETALAQLQKIVERMESKEQSLEDSIKDYELGTQLAQQCQQRLDEAQLKVQKLTKTADGYRSEPLVDASHSDDGEA